MERASSGWKALFRSVLIMIGVVFACSAAAAFAVDQTCVADAQTWLPRYPGAVVIEDRHTLLRSFGMGETLQTLYTPDPEDVVFRWYAAAIRETSQQKNKQRIARTEWATTPAEDEGTLITLYSACAI